MFLLSLTFGLVISHNNAEHWAWFGALGLVALVSGLLPPEGEPDRVARVLEVVVAVAAAIDTFGETTSTPNAFLPYLVAPAMAAGLSRGAEGAALLPAIATLAFVVGGLVKSLGNESAGYVVTAVEWIILTVAAGLAGAWASRLLRPRPNEDLLTSETSYVAAYRLLSQLRPVARQLSAGLDPVTIAQSMLAALQAEVGFRHGALYARTSGDRLTTLAHLGSERPPDWDVAVTGADTPFAEAWLTQRPRVVPYAFSGGAGAGMVLPLTIGLRTFGLVAVEAREATRFGPTEVTVAEEIAGIYAMRLETALLFDEVRGIATVEERRRLAREIHDGIAQELSALGYVVDDLAQQAGARSRSRIDAEMQQSLQSLRHEITRIVNELRLSIFDLRSEVDTHGGLGAALTEYVRGVGRSSGLTVHLSLREEEARLPADAEAELLRIAQEAVTNSRKHAGAENLWVTLVVDAPRALLRIEDDGRGIRGSGRHDSYGLEIMRERAGRLRGRLRVEGRRPRGTLVELTIGSRDRLATLGAENDHGGARG